MCVVGDTRLWFQGSQWGGALRIGWSVEHEQAWDGSVAGCLTCDTQPARGLGQDALSHAGCAPSHARTLARPHPDPSIALHNPAPPVTAQRENLWRGSSLETQNSLPLTEPPSDDLGSLHPGALLFRAAGHPPSLPTMADALAHGADVNWVNGGHENATPLIQATAAVRAMQNPPGTLRLL